MEANRGRQPGTVWLRWAVVGALFVLLIALGRQAPLQAWIESLGGTIEALGPWGPAAFAGLYVLSTLLLLPGSLLTIAAGALFGAALGTATVSIASTLSASLAFLIARHFARDTITRLTERQPRFSAIDRAIGEQGWKIVGLLRLSPAMPFSVSNYLYGLTGIPFGSYVLVSWIAMLPGTFLYVYIGAVARVGVETAVQTEGTHASTLEWTFRIVGLLATIAVTILITRIARRALRETTDITSPDASPKPPAV